MQNNIKELIQKDMSRKEFLGILGFSLASIFGFSTLLHLLGHKSPLHNDSSAGYGSSVYGGR